MNTTTRIRIVCLAVLLGLSAACHAAAFNAGDKVEYKGGDGNWVPGTVIRMMGDTQVLIRQQPSQFYPEGFERTYSLSDVRMPGAQAVPQQQPPARTAAATAAAPANAPAPAAKPAAAPTAGGGGLMSQQDVLGHLARLGDQPFQHPQREQIRRELAEMMKQRGVNFRYEIPSDFANQLAKYGASTDITSPIALNFGPPTQRNFLFGAWAMDIIGSPTYFVRGNTLYRRGEIGAKGGLLTINPNGTYVWQAYMKDPADKHFRGKWRDATAQEMGHQGGAGIVLLAAKAGWDWIVTQERDSQAGDAIRASDLGTRGMREFGGRQGR